MIRSHRLKILGIAKSLRKEMEAKYGDLAGFCFEASQNLIVRLQEVHYKPKLVEGHVKLRPQGHVISGQGYHFWVEVDRNYLDITGDQFNKLLNLRLPKILLRPRSQCPQYIAEQIIKC